MGPGELALVLLVSAAVATGTWTSRDARRRGVGPVAAGALGVVCLVTFPLGPVLYARLRHRVGAGQR